MKKLYPYCNTDSGRYFRSRDYKRKITKEKFDHYHRPRCNLVFISPIPENLGDYYPQAYYFFPESTDDLDAGVVHERYKIEIIQRYVKQGRLLEIGLIQSARTYIYTMALSPAVAEATRASLKLVRTEPWRRERVRARIEQFRRGAHTLGLTLLDSNTPIQPVILGEPELAVTASHALRARPAGAGHTPTHGGAQQRPFAHHLFRRPHQCARGPLVGRIGEPEVKSLLQPT